MRIYIDDATWYADAILNGGSKDDITFYPVMDESVRTSILDVKAVLAQLKNLTQ